MNKNRENPELFDIICIFAFLSLLCLSVYLFSNSKYIRGVLALLLSTWAFVIVVGKIVIGPAYLEGHIVRLLIKNDGKMKESDLQKYYERYGSMAFVLDRLKQRNVIAIRDGCIELLAHDVRKGFRNRLMMWGTRKVRI